MSKLTLLLIKLKKISQRLLTDPFCLALLTIVIGTALINFRSDVWLTGWDTLHPEFDYGLSFKRLLSGVWRSDQGLGALAAHAHMSDLPRVLVLWLLDLVLPTHTVKFVYVLLTLVLGPLGVYYFLKLILAKSFKKQRIVQLAAFLASLFYFFNLITVQHFYVVFEMFAVQYAALGWLFYLITLYLNKGYRRTLWWLLVVNFLASPMAYAPLLWYVYFASVLGYLFFSAFFKLKANFKLHLHRRLLVIVVILLANAYWLLPNFYYIASGAGQIPEQAHINRLFSDEAFLQNKMFGDLRDLALFKNFLFNWTVYSPRTEGQVPLLAVWEQHLPELYITEIGYGLVLLALIGLIWAVVKRQRFLLALVPIFLGSVFMLINDNPPLGWLFRWLREQNSVLAEATRFPFTKFSLIFLFTTVCFFAFGVGRLLEHFEHYKNKVFLQLIFSALIIVSLLSYSLPYFQGELISRKMENQIPEPYFQLFDWFKTQPQGRILTLPMHSLYGWKYHTWGYEGAGFLWFGLDQPVVERDFDRWNPANETLYEQVSTALYAQDSSTFTQLLNKYDIQYVLLDKTATTTGNQDLLWFNQSRQLLLASGFELAYEDDFLQVYATAESEPLVQTLPSLPVVKTAQTYTRQDAILSTIKNYLTSTESKTIEIFQPFADITVARQSQVETTEWGTTTELALKRDWPAQPQRYYFGFADLDLTNERLTFQIKAAYKAQQLQVQILLPLIIKVDQDYLVEFEPITQIFEFPEPIADFSHLSLTINNWAYSIDELLAEPQYITLVVDQSVKLRLLSIRPQVNGTQQIKAIFDGNIDQDLWTQLRTDLNKQFYYQADKPAVIQAVYVTAPIKVDLASSARINNCDLFKRGEVDKTVADDRVVYRADNNGAACENINLEVLSNHQSYLFELVGENLAGRNLKLSLHNWETNRLDLVELVSPKFNHFYSMLSWPTLAENHYSLYLENKSFGGPAYNSVDRLSFYPYPLKIVAALRLSQDLASLTVLDQPADQNKVESEVLKGQQSAGTFFYKLQLAPKQAITENLTLGENRQIANTLTLSQSYDPAWLALQKIGNFKYKLLPHYQFNGWANAWSLFADAQTVYLIFWPQLLEFVGLGLVAISLGWLGFKVLQEIRTNRSNS